MTFIFARVAGHGLVITASDPLPNLEVFAIRPAPILGIRKFSSLAFLLPSHTLSFTFCHFFIFFDKTLNPDYNHA